MNDRRFRWRLRLLATSVGLTALAFVQAPGLIVSDTKFDLAVRPGLFLAKVIHLWDPLGDFGQVQNQAYGYLFPMGPFFLVGHLVDAPAWVVQRAWWALVLVVAFLGIVKLCGVLRIGSPWARILAGVAFALSPRMLTNLGPISIENWPSAVAPWVLVPLVIGAQRGSARQAAARSGLAAAFVGSVNAVASAAILPLSALWLLTRRRGRRRGTMLRWWPVFVGLATLWWLVPLLVLGRFSPPFLDYIESASGTTAPATIADALRGTTKWVPYVATDYTAGRGLLTHPMAIIESGLLVVLGLLGLVRRDLAERRFLVLSLLVGLFLVTMGHLGAVQGVLAPTLNEQLDQVLAPLRNTHKWDALIRVPLVLGLAHLVTIVGTKVVDGVRQVRQDQVALRAGVVMLAVAAFLGTASVAFSASLASAGAFEKTPAYWKQAARWMETHDDGLRTYVTPGSPFGDFTWGTPMDEPVQALADAPWATRSVIPLVPGSNIRMMDAIEARFVNGDGSLGLHDYLSRAGIRYVMVRGDLRTTSALPNAARVHQAIATTPGLRLVASFGPRTGGDSRLDRGDRSAAFVDNGWQAYHRAIEIYEVRTNTGETRASTYARSDLPVFVGDSSTLLRSLEMGALSNQPVEFARDASLSAKPSAVVLTDGTRRQEVEYGRVHDNRSASHTVDEPWQTTRPVRDYDTGSAARWLTVPRLEGATSVRATSSASNAGYVGEIDPSAQPFSAVDGDPDTAWVSGLPVKGEHALTLRLERPTRVDRVRLAVPYVGDARDRAITVTTSTGSVRTEVTAGDSKRVRTSGGMTTFVRVSTRADLGRPLRISDLVVPGVHVTRPLVTPAYPARWGAADSIALSVDDGERSGCVQVDGDTRCAEGTERLGEDGRTIDRVVRLPVSADYTPVVGAQPWGGADLTAAIQAGRSTTVAASSQATHQALSGAFAAVDGDDTTGWVAAAGDTDPTLRVAWPERRRLSSIRLTTSDGLVASTATRVVIDFDGGRTRTVALRDGRGTFEPVTSATASVRLVEDDDATSVSRDGQTGRSLPVGVSELAFPGAPLDDAPLSDRRVVQACGTGPDLSVDGTTRQTALDASPAAMYRGDTLDARVCGDAVVSLRQGETSVRVTPSSLVRPVSLRLQGDRLVAPAPATSTREVHHDAATTTADPAGTGSLLLLRDNQNAGWGATQDGRSLRAMTVDGWQQGWAGVRGDEPVDLHFAPDSVYRGGLLAGLVGIALVVLASFHPRFGRAGRDAPPVEPLAIGWAPATVVVGGFALLVGGVPGLAGMAAGWALGTLVAVVGRRRGRTWDAGAGVALALAAVYGAYALRPWGGELEWMGREAWPQLLALGALAAALAAAFEPDASRLLRRIAGRSRR